VGTFPHWAMDDTALKLKADLIKALAHPTRLKIIEFLKDGERCVCEITPFLGLEQSNVSQHLGLLRDRGILSSRKEGMSVFYRVRNPEVFKVLEVLDSLLLRDLDEKRELLTKLEAR